MKTATVIPSALRLSGAATFLGVSPGTVRNLARAGKLRSVLLNRARVFGFSPFKHCWTGSRRSRALRQVVPPVASNHLTRITQPRK